MSKHHDKRFPNEPDDYRNARDELLTAEIELRRSLDKVAQQRKTLTLGGRLKEDYIFIEGGSDLNDTETIKETRFSELFEHNKHNLIIYSLMYAPDAESPCPACTSILDSFNGSEQHIRSSENFVVIGKATIDKIRTWANGRKWNNLRLL